MTDALLNARQVGALLGLNEKTVRIRAARGEIKATRLSDTPRGRIRFRQADVDAYVDSRRPVSA